MRRINKGFFYILVIVVAMLFCARSVNAEGVVSLSNQYSTISYWYGTPITGSVPLTVCQDFGDQLLLEPGGFTAILAVNYDSPPNCWLSTIKDGSTYNFTRVLSVNTVCPPHSSGSGTCVCDSTYQPNAGGTACVLPCVAPGAWAGQTMDMAGENGRTVCAPDLCVYDVGNSVTGGYAAEPPNIHSMVWLNDATGATCTVVDGAGVGGCPAGQADLGFGCMNFAENEAAFNAVSQLGAYVDPCIAAGTCTSLIDPCIAAGTCVGTGTGVGGTAGSGGTGVGGSTYVDPCIAAGTCTAAADPCIAAGTCTGSGTGTGGTAGGVNPCIAAGTCAGSGTGTGSGTGSATESTLKSVLDTLRGLGDFGSVADADLGTKTVDVVFTPVAVGTNGSCPIPSPMTLHGQTYYFVWDTYCNFASGIKPILLVFAWLSAAGILIGGLKSA